MPIPAYDPKTGYLPAGDWAASLKEVEHMFGTRTYRRREVFRGLARMVTELESRGVTDIWVDGSFVTTKDRPSDVDLVYQPPQGADLDTWGILSPAQRKRLKDRERVDLWPLPSFQRASRHLGVKPTIKDFFAKDEDGVSKGLVKLIGGNDEDSE